MRRFVVCTSKSLGDVSGDDLTVGKLYEVVAEERGMLRVIDDSGEDYLYPSGCFEEA
jgi:hypothetical protein